MLELAILGLLKEHPMHGYDLRKRLRGDFGLLSSLSFGSLYPALARLEASGAVHEVSADRRPSDSAVANTIPSSGSIAGEKAAFRARLASRRAASARSGNGTRGRRVYELTARGDELFHRLLATEEPKPEGGRGFALRWAFARYLTSEDRLMLLQRRRAQLLATQAGSRLAAEAPWRPLDRYQRSLVDHANEATDHDLKWIDRLIAAEQAAQAPTSVPAVLPKPDGSAASSSLVVTASPAQARPALNIPASERSEP
ncbi:MAG: PadR family transcriptional regulator [Acidimicrobiales bacterium]